MNSSAFRLRLMALSVGLLAAGCGENDITLRGESDSPPEAFSIEAGVAQKGPLLRGSWVSVNELDPPRLQPTGRSFNFEITDDTGRFNPAGISFSQRFLESTALGYFFNEVSGKSSTDLVILRAMSDARIDRTLNLNVLTDLAHGRTRGLTTRASKPMDFSIARSTAQAEVLRGFFIYNRDDLFPGGSSGPTGFGELDLGKARTSDQILAAISGLFVHSAGSTQGALSELINRAEADITDDGVLNNSPQFERAPGSELNAAAKDVDWSGIALNLNRFYRTSAFTAKNLSQWTDSSGGVDRVIDRFKHVESNVAVGVERRSPDYAVGSEDVGQCFIATAGTLYRGGRALTGAVIAVRGNTFSIGLSAPAAGQAATAFLQRAAPVANNVCPPSTQTASWTRVFKFTVSAVAPPPVGGDISFVPSSAQDAGPGPHYLNKGMVTGRFNSDSLVDLAVLNPSEGNPDPARVGTVAIFVGGTGSPILSKVAEYPIGVNARAMAGADLDNDGALDLIVGALDQSLYILRGKGDGTFEPARPVGLSLRVGSVAVGDVNKDGFVDVIVGSPDGDQPIGILLNGPTGLAPMVRIEAAGSQTLTVADLDGDGNPDIVGADWRGPSTVSIFFGRGNGTFEASVQIPTTQAGAETPVVADLNGDGTLDIVLANYYSNSATILSGLGARNFSAPSYVALGSNPQTVAVVDFNRDGVPDIASTGNGGYTVLQRASDGSIARRVDANGNWGNHDMAIADFDADGFPDIATLLSGTTNRLELFLNRSQATP